MKQKLIFLIFFVICLTSVSVYAVDYCCYDGDQRPACNDDCQETSCGPNMVFNKAPEICACECGGEISCEQNYVWNQEKCACECGGEISCEQNYTWNQEKCDCECGGEQSCEQNYVWNQEKCACECGGEISCEQNYTWNQEKCDCECGGEQSCEGNKTWNKDSCSCECSGEQSCGENQTWDSEQCKCVCAETSCTGGKTQNKDTCACECPEGQTEVSNGQCCAPENVAEGYGGIKTCCQGTDPHTQSTPQCCTKTGGHWLSQTDSGGSDGRCCAADESAYDDNGQLGCCKNCCVKDSSGKPTPFAAGVQGGSSTGRVDPACCEAAGGEYASDTTGTFYGGVCCKGSKDIAHDNKLIKTCCTKAGGSLKKINGTEKCCKCPSGGC